MGVISYPLARDMPEVMLDTNEAQELRARGRRLRSRRAEVDLKRVERRERECRRPGELVIVIVTVELLALLTLLVSLLVSAISEESVVVAGSAAAAEAAAAVGVAEAAVAVAVALLLVALWTDVASNPGSIMKEYGTVRQICNKITEFFRKKEIKKEQILKKKRAMK